MVQDSGQGLNLDVLGPAQVELPVTMEFEVGDPALLQELVYPK